MSTTPDPTNDPTPTPDEPDNAGEDTGAPPEGERTFDAAYVAEIRREAAKYRTKAKAEEKARAEAEAANRTVEERLAAMEIKATRADLCAELGITPGDGEVFLTGPSPAAMRAQGERLIARDKERLKHGNHVPREGTNPKPQANELTATARRLFGTGG